jgi:nucleoside-diphosphate-sugar epimerase
MQHNHKKALIIGANSILSVAIFHKLHDLNYEILGVRHQSNQNIPNAFLTISTEDLFDLSNDFDVVFFISAYIPKKETLDDVAILYATNIDLLKKVSHHFSKAQIIHSSSVSIFKNSGAIITEKSDILPISHYSISKFWAEKIVTNHPAGGINIRISSLYGEGMKANSFLPIVIKNAIEHRKITLYGDGQRQQNYISATQAATYFVYAIGKKCAYPLLGTNTMSHSNLDIATIIKTYLGSDIEIKFEGQDTSPHAIYDNRETLNFLNLSISDTPKHTIQQLIQWSQKQY